MKSNETQRHLNRAVVGSGEALSCSINGFMEPLIGPSCFSPRAIRPSKSRRQPSHIASRPFLHGTLTAALDQNDDQGIVPSITTRNVQGLSKELILQLVPAGRSKGYSAGFTTAGPYVVWFILRQPCAPTEAEIPTYVVQSSQPLSGSLERLRKNNRADI